MYTPVYTITNSILKYIGIVEAAKEVIANAPLLPYYEKKFQNDAMVRSVYHGTHLEGNELNKSQAERVLQGEEVIARARDVQEVINYRKVMELIEESGIHTSGIDSRNQESPQRRQMSAITQEFIKKIHGLTVEKILDAEKAGYFRKTQVVVKNNLTHEVTFRPPPANEVLGQIADLIAFINSNQSQEIHPVLRSGIVHYEFVRIHPFVDGNGRVGRALSTLILFQEGYDIRKFFSLEEYFDTNATDYYFALQSVTKHEGNLTEWLSYFTQGLAIELTKIKEKVERISIDGKLKQKLGGAPILLTDRQLKLIEYIQETGYLQNSGFKQLFPFVSEDTVLNELKALMQYGIIKKHGSTKGARYVMV